MNRIFICVLVCFLSGCAVIQSAQLSASRFEGVWEGYGVQDEHTRWAVTISIIGDQYQVEYPSLGCGGKMDLLSSNENTIEFREHLLYGLAICEDKGRTILIKTGNDSALFRWYYPNGKIGATGSLSREKMEFL